MKLSSFGLAFTAVLLVFPACSKESSDDASAPVTSASAPTCGRGTHALDGKCVPDVPPPAEMASTGDAPSGSASAAPPPGKCPDPSAADRVAAFDWQKELAVEPAISGKLRGLAGAAAETKAFSLEIEAELRGLCTRMATELGAKGPFGDADVTCQAASDALRAARAKLGPAAKISSQVHQPICPESNGEMEACSKLCTGGDVSDAPKCGGGVVGKCPGGCEGACELRGMNKCDATCVGKCASGFSGKCSGVCKGTCDAKDMKAGGTCAGKCEGICEGTANGECKGLCEGACQGKPLPCSGICTGKCATPLTDLACNGVLAPAGSIGPECSAACGTRAARRATCTLPSVSFTVTGAKEAPAGSAYELAVEHALPQILRIERRLRGRVEGIAKNQKLVGDGLKDATGKGLAPNVAACLLPFEKAVTEGVTSLSSNYRAVSLLSTLAQGK